MILSKFFSSAFSMDIFNFLFFVQTHISAKIWATFTLVKALKSFSEGFVAISLNLEAILVFFSS